MRRFYLAAPLVLGLVACGSGYKAAPVPQRPSLAAPTSQAPDLAETTMPQVPESKPTAADFKLTPKILDQECFGSAGCNVQLRVNLAYSGPDLYESDTWLVTYSISGDEDGPRIGTLRVQGSMQEAVFTGDDEYLSTRSASTKIRIKVTDVSKELE